MRLWSRRYTATECLVNPNSARIHKLFARSEIIATLQRLPSFEAEERAKLQAKCLGNQ